MILNPEKCHYMSFGKDFDGDLLRFCAEVLEASQTETVLGIQIDKLNFENHIKSLCSKASQKLGALQRFSNLLDAQKKSSVQFYNKISVQLLPTGLNVLLKKIKLSSQRCS